MKKQLIVSLLIFAAGLMIQSCGHTNKLSKYDLSNKKILYDQEFTGVVEANLYLNNAPTRTGVEVADVVIDVAKSIGEAIVEGDAQAKLIKAANPDEVAASVSEELKQTMVKYLSVNPTNNVGDGYLYIVTTRLKEITLNSTEFDLFLHLNAEVEITEQGSADVVWDYCDDKTISLRNYLSEVNNGNFNPNVSDIMQVAQLLTLSESQLRQVINMAARDIGREFSKQFRKDLSKARGK